MRRVFRPRARRGVRNIISLLKAARRGVALALTAALVNLAGPSAAATTAAAPPAPSGQVVAAAGLTLDGSTAVVGQTVFPGCALDAAGRARPALSLGNRARLELSGGARLTLDFTASSVGGALGAGGARVYAPRGVNALFTTADASVASDASADDALFTLRVSEEGTTLDVQSGRVEMRAGGRALAAGAGESLRAAHGSAPEPAPPQGNSLSGRRRAGLIVGIAAAVAAVLIVIAGRSDEEEIPDEICPVPVFSFSPVELPPC